MAAERNPDNGHDRTAASLARLTERVDGLCRHQETQDARLDRIDDKLTKVVKFVDACDGGRSVILLLMKIAGAGAALFGVGWALFKHKIGGG